MLLIIGIVLLVLWIGGFFVFHIASWAIHLLVLFAIASLVFPRISGRPAVSLRAGQIPRGAQRRPSLFADLSY